MNKRIIGILMLALMVLSIAPVSAQIGIRAGADTTTVEIVYPGTTFSMSVNSVVDVKGENVKISLQDVSTEVLCTTDVPSSECEEITTAHLMVSVYDDSRDGPLVPGRSEEIRIEQGQTLELFTGHELKFEAYNGETANFIINSEDGTGTITIVKLGTDFQMEEGSSVSIANIAFMTLDSLEKSRICPQIGNCREIHTATIGISPNFPLKEGQDVRANAILEIKEGESKSAMGLRVYFKEYAEGTATFRVENANNPIISIGRDNLGIKISTRARAPAQGDTGSEAEADIKAESLRISPGDADIKAKMRNTNEERAIQADLKAGVSIPVQSDSGAREVVVRSNEQELRTYIRDGSVEAKTRAPVISKNTGLYVETSNGEERQIKVLPEQASRNAQAVLGTIFDEIELKENGHIEYEMSSDVEGKLLGFIPVKMKYRASVDAESGEVVSSKKPWYKFMTRVRASGNASADAANTEAQAAN